MYRHQNCAAVGAAERRTRPGTVRLATTILRHIVLIGAAATLVGCILGGIPALPTFDPPEGTYETVQAVAIGTGTPADIVYYTTDGTSPTSSSERYTTPIVVDHSLTLKARAVSAGGLASGVASAEYTIASDDGDDTTDDPPQAPTAPVSRALDSAYVSITEGRIVGVSPSAEYSIDGGATWTGCEGGAVDVDFAVGDDVRVRLVDDAESERHLGTIASLAGPDLVAGSFLYNGKSDEQWAGVPGEAAEIFYNVANRSEPEVTAQITARFYLSDDTTITGTDDDRPIATERTTLEVPTSPPTGGYYLDFTVPEVDPGRYYIGAIVDVDDDVDEAVEGNNATLPADAQPFQVLDPTPLPDGAFKLINSWGTDGDWENIADGHYWITYEAAKQLELQVVYYRNTFTPAYEPRVIVLFEATHPRRSAIRISFGLGSPAAPITEVEFAPRWEGSEGDPLADDTASGRVPFPSSRVAFDLTDFAPLINDYDLYMRVENFDTTESVTIGDIDVEYYDDYDDSPFDTVSAETITVAAGAKGIHTISTEGRLTSTQLGSITAVPRTVAGDGLQLDERLPNRAELARDMAVVGVAQPGTNYNTIVRGTYGTGFRPPTAAEWERRLRLFAIDAASARSVLPNEVDLSQAESFPPIGHQGEKGTCSAFALAYYVHTYTMGREYGWDLTYARWLSTDPYFGSDAGGPSMQYAKRVFSPDFVYHLVNDGVDAGSAPELICDALARNGSASWDDMPYNTRDAEMWADEDGWREALRYRVPYGKRDYFVYDTAAYFTITTDAEIDMLKRLLAEGHMPVTAVYAGDDVSYGVYGDLSEQDVLSDAWYWSGEWPNHTQTIVGYREGIAWNEDAPGR